LAEKKSEQNFFLFRWKVFEPTCCCRMGMGANHKSLEVHRIKPWKVKNIGGRCARGISAPKQYIYCMLCHGKL
jgi:hypothetical protein